MVSESLLKVEDSILKEGEHNTVVGKVQFEGERVKGLRSQRKEVLSTILELGCWVSKVIEEVEPPHLKILNLK